MDVIHIEGSRGALHAVMELLQASIDLANSTRTLRALYGQDLDTTAPVATHEELAPILERIAVAAYYVGTTCIGAEEPTTFSRED